VKRLGVQVWVLVDSALRGLRASPVTSVVAILTIAVALVLVGAFALVVANMQRLVVDVGAEIRVTAFLEEDIDEDAQRALAQRVATVEGVEGVELVSKQDALERFRATLGGAELVEGLEENPLPASLEIALLPGHRSEAGLAIVESALDGLPGIDELAFGQEWIEGYARATALVRSAAVGLGVILAGAALLIVANTIRLAVYARQDEIEILALVGAGRAFVRIPFLIEGLLQGVVGGALAVVLLYAAFRVLVPQVEYGLELFLGRTQPHFFAAGGVLRMILGGGGLGALGSATALMGWRA